MKRSNGYCGHILLCAFAAMTAFTLAACQSDPRAAAVERAREYALGNAQDLSEVQKSTIRYCQPEIYDNLVSAYNLPPAMANAHLVTRFDKYEYDYERRDFLQQCMVWKLPDMNGDFIVVGFGERTYKYWRPNRIVVKNIVPRNEMLYSAAKTSVGYYIENMPDISDGDRYTIRFTEPEVFSTVFDLTPPEPDPADAANAPEIRWTQVLGITPAAEDIVMEQISFVWTSRKDGSKMVVAGNVLPLAPEMQTETRTTTFSPLKAMRIKFLELQQNIAPAKTEPGTAPAAQPEALPAQENTPAENKAVPAETAAEEVPAK